MITMESIYRVARERYRMQCRENLHWHAPRASIMKSLVPIPRFRRLCDYRSSV